MSTCPRCKGHLTESHRCPRRPLVVALEVGLAAAAGGFLGLLLAAIFDPRGNLDGLLLIGGVVAGVAINRMLR